MSLSAILAGGVIGSALGYGLYRVLKTPGGFPFGNFPSVVDAGPLSERRQRVLDEIAKVVPSQYPDEKFKLIAPGYDPDNLPLPNFTTCGYLPCYAGRVLKHPKCITQGGLEQMRINGRADGSWVDNDGRSLPRPGDLYGVSAGGGVLVHVGVVIAASDVELKTADAGQELRGRPGKAAYVTRPYDRKTRTSGGVGAVYKPESGWVRIGKDGSEMPRVLAGWIDLDKVPLEGIGALDFYARGARDIVVGDFYRLPSNWSGPN